MGSQRGWSSGEGCSSAAVWDDAYLDYDFGDHPFHPLRLELTMYLARLLGVLDHIELRSPRAADEATLLTAHTSAYLSALRAASVDPTYQGHGLGTSDDPVFARMYEAGALVAGGSVLAARDVWTGRVAHSVNIAGGLHHAMADSASGFCVVNDIVAAIRWLLANGAERVAYIDVDVHHGDGVQAAFFDDPRVLTVSLHQHPSTLFPGTGRASEIGSGPACGTAVNLALPPGVDDEGWLTAFGAVVPSVIRAFKPDVLVTQCGCDTHHDDPLADMKLTVDGQRAAYQWLHRLAHDYTDGRWVATGGGGYGLIRCVPRAWTHLLAEVSGRPIDPTTPVPRAWMDEVYRRGATGDLPATIGEGRTPQIRDWVPTDGTWLARSIMTTRRAVFPLLGLDPEDPRD
jgi:acetoin utilization protein AcuC